MNCVLLQWLVIFVALQFAANAQAKDYRIDVAAPIGGREAKDVPGDSNDQGATTIAKALAAARVIREKDHDANITIQLGSGTYRLHQAIVLTDRDSGTAATPLVLQGQSDGSTNIVGSQPLLLRATSAKETGSNAITTADLKGLHLPTPAFVALRGQPRGVTSSGLELFRDDRPLHFARWPDKTYSTDISARQTDDGTTVVTFMNGSVAARASTAPAFIAGYPSRPWSFDTTIITPIPDKLGTATLGPLGTTNKIKKHFLFFIFNSIDALNQADEFVLDAAKQLVYVLADSSNSTIEAATIPTLIEIQSASNIVINNIALGNTLSNVVEITDSHSIKLKECLIHNSGSRGVLVQGGSDVGISRCVISDTAETAVELIGGDKTTLEAAHHVVRDSIITRFGRESRTYRPGVQLRGVGNIVDGSLICDGYHSGIILAGNDHVIQNNELSELVQESDDAGAIYMGRSWTDRGVVISKNYLHDIGEDVGKLSIVSGIYLDDQASGVTVSTNTFFRVNRPVILGGGRDNKFDHNLYVLMANAAIRFDDRGRKRAKQTAKMIEELKKINFRHPPYATRYPRLTTMLDNDPGDPKDNSFLDEIIVNGPLLKILGNFKDVDVSGTVSLVEQSLLPTSPTVPADALGQYVERLLQPNERLPLIVNRVEALRDLLFLKRAW